FGKLADLGVTHRLGGQVRRKLALSSWPDAKDDVPAGNGESNRTAVIGFDHREGKIHSRGHPGGGRNAALLDAESRAIYLDRRTEPLERLDRTPMGGRAAMVERTSRGQKERTAADRREPRHATDCAADDPRDRTARELGAHAQLTAHRHERVDTRK